MSDKLKHFIEQHRDEFDVQLPGDLWPGIDTGMSQKTSFIKSKTLGKMIKYGFGASAVVIGTMVVLNLKPDEIKRSQSQPKPVEQIQTITPAQLPQEKKVIYAEKKVDENTTQRVPPNSNDFVSDSVENEAENLVAKCSPGYKYEFSYEYNSDTEKESETNLNSEIKTRGSSSVRDDSSQSKYFTPVDTLFKDVSRLEIAGGSCNIHIRGGAGDDVKISGEVGGAAGNVVVCGTRWFMNKTSVVRYEKSGSTLKVWIEEKKLEGRVRAPKEARKTSYLNFTVPAKILATVNNGSGDIAVHNLEGERVDLTTDYGNISAYDLKTELSTKASSGHVTIKHLDGNLKSKTSFGHQNLEDVTGNAIVNASSGHIHVKNLKGNLESNSSFGHQTLDGIKGDISTVISSGNLVVKHSIGKISAKSSFGRQTFQEIEGDINSQASSGSIEINGSKGNLGITTSFGNITGKNIKLLSNSEFKTSSGSIHMTFENDMNELRFDLHSSSGNLLVDKNNTRNQSDKSLNVGEGAILVKGISSFGNQNYH